MLLTDTFWNRPYRYDLNQARAVLWIPNVYSGLVRRMVGSTMSKAAERSGTVPESEARSESFTVVAELLKDDFLKKLGNERKVYVKEDGLGAMVGVVGKLEKIKEVVI